MTENHNRFWKYVKSQSSKFDKASILNEFFQSVFTKENVDDMPETDLFPFAPNGNIIVGVSGNSKLLSYLNPSKASGPDQIPLYLLKIYSDVISPVLQVIYQSSRRFSRRDLAQAPQIIDQSN